MSERSAEGDPGSGAHGTFSGRVGFGAGVSWTTERLEGDGLAALAAEAALT